MDGDWTPLRSTSIKRRPFVHGGTPDQSGLVIAPRVNSWAVSTFRRKRPTGLNSHHYFNILLDHELNEK
jgi:hypothetical protein